MNLNFSQRQEKALKKYAALQFPKSIDRFDTSHPIYLIMKNDGDWVSSSLDDAEYDMDTEEYLFERDDISENSIENFVMAVLGISEDEIEEYNNGLLDDNPPFMSFNEALDRKKISSHNIEVMNIEDYLDMYTIDPDTVNVYRKEGNWVVQEVAFTYADAQKFLAEYKNGQYDKSVRMQVLSISGDTSSALMDVMFQLGDALLHEECKGLSWEEINRQGPSELTAIYYNEPNLTTMVAKYEMQVPAGLLENDEPVTATMTVFTEGHMEGIGNKEFPVARLYVVLETPNCTKKTVYPFESDYVGKNLGSREGVFRLFNYIRFA